MVVVVGRGEDGNDTCLTGLPQHHSLRGSVFREDTTREKERQKCYYKEDAEGVDGYTGLFVAWTKVLIGLIKRIPRLHGRPVARRPLKSLVKVCSSFPGAAGATGPGGRHTHTHTHTHGLLAAAASLAATTKIFATFGDYQRPAVQS